MLKNSGKYKLIVKRKNKKNLSMIVEAGTVIVSVPNYYTDDLVQDYVDSKEKWIQKQLDKEKLQPKFVEKNFLNGEKFRFLGKEVYLNIEIGDKNQVDFENDIISVRVKDNLEIKDTLKNWFKNQANEIFTKKTVEFCKILEIEYPKVNIKQYKTKWAQCKRKKLNDNFVYEVSYDWRIIQASLKVIDYIIIHELCHIKVFDHSKDFWSLVNYYFKETSDYKNWLDENAFTLYWEAPTS